MIGPTNSIIKNNTHNYSTTEHIIGVWTNGNPIYEKTFFMRTQRGTESTMDISDLNIYMPISCEIICHNDNNFSWSFDQYFFESGDFRYCWISNDKKTFYIKTGNRYAAGDNWITLRYIKLSEKLQPLIPTLNSNIGSNGTVICSSTYCGGSYNNPDVNQAYKAFDNNYISYVCYQTENQIDGYIGYEFTTPVSIKAFTAYQGNFRAANSFKVQPQVYINNEWTNIENYDYIVTGYNENYKEKYTKEFDEAITTTGFRLLFPDITKTDGTNIMTYELQVYSELE